MSDKIQEIICRCKKDGNLTPLEIKSFFIELSNAIEEPKKVSEMSVSEITQEIEPPNCQEHINKLRVEISESYLELRRGLNKELEKVHNDLKHFLVQFEVDYGVLDEYCYLMVNRFERQINEELREIYSLLRKKNSEIKEYKPREMMKECEKFYSHDCEEGKEEWGRRTIKLLHLETIGGKKEKKTKSSKRTHISKNISKKWINNLNNFVKESKSKLVFGKDWVHPQCYHLPDLVFDENQISSLGNIFILAKESLPECFTFVLRFDQIHEAVSLGIACKKYCDRRVMGDECKCLIEYTNDGYVYADNRYIKRQGQGYKSGEKVTISGNLKEKWITFSVDGEMRANLIWKEFDFENKEPSNVANDYVNFHQFEGFGNNSLCSTQKYLKKEIEWVPYVVMEVNDAITVLGTG